MRAKKFHPLIGVIVAASLLAGLLPHVLASGLAPGEAEFTGFLINPLDGFSYLAKMRQGADGSWLFRLPYAADPGTGALLFTFYLALGHIAGSLQAELITVFHGARLAFGALMLAAGYLFLRRVASDRTELTWGLALFAFGSGLGWLAGPLGLLTTDLTVPESIPFFSLLVNPHFPLATALLAGFASLLLAEARRPASDLVLGLGLGAALAMVQPFAVLTPLAVVPVWLAWELVRVPAPERRARLLGLRPQLERLAAFGAGAAPWLLYDLWAVRSLPALAAWNAQNLTPSPAPWAFLLGFGVVGGLAAAAAARSETRSSPVGRFLIVWLVVNFALLYAPFNLQRRLALGMFLPLAALAGSGMKAVVRSRARGGLLAAALFAFAIPSNLLVAAAGLAQVAGGDPSLLYAPGERLAYGWIERNAAPDSLVLAAPVIGNRLPAFADVRVLYGHPFETPQARSQEDMVLFLYQSALTQDLHAAGVDYTIVGPRAMELGQPIWLTELELRLQAGDFSVYEVP